MEHIEESHNNKQTIFDTAILINKNTKKTKNMMRDINELLLKNIRTSNIKNIKMLLDIGADVNYDNGKPLLWSTYQHSMITELLLNNGADIHANNDQALICAATNGETDTVALLLKRGANIHAQNDRALRNAIFYEHVSTIKILMDNGAYVSDEPSCNIL